MYSQVNSKFWQDEKMIKLNAITKYVFLHLLSCPNRNIWGCFHFSKTTAIEETGLSKKKYLIAFDELVNLGIIEYDEDSRMLLIVNFLKHNPIENDNQVKGAISKLIDLPKSKLWTAVIQSYSKYCKKSCEVISALNEMTVDECEKTNECAFDEESKLSNSNNSSSSNNSSNNNSNNLFVLSDGFKTNIQSIAEMHELNLQGVESFQNEEQSFNSFWNLYPRKNNKKEAMNAWKKLKIDEAKYIEIMKGLLKSIEKSISFKSERFTPFAAKWLSDERWNDEFTGKELNEKDMRKPYEKHDYSESDLAHIGVDFDDDLIEANAI